MFAFESLVLYSLKLIADKIKLLKFKKREVVDDLFVVFGSCGELCCPLYERRTDRYQYLDRDALRAGMIILPQHPTEVRRLPFVQTNHSGAATRAHPKS